MSLLIWQETDLQDLDLVSIRWFRVLENQFCKFVSKQINRRLAISLIVVVGVGDSDHLQLNLLDKLLWKFDI